MCVHRLPFSNELGFLSHFPPLAIDETRDGEPNGLTMVAFVKQFGTGWKEDIGELRDLSDYVHCSQNSLQRLGAQRGQRSPGMGRLPHNLCHMSNYEVSGGANV